MVFWPSGLPQDQSDAVIFLENSHIFSLLVEPSMDHPLVKKTLDPMNCDCLLSAFTVFKVQAKFFYL